MTSSNGTRTGTVKWFSDEKGFGFLTGEDGEDAFVHFSAIEGQNGRKTLIQGATVSYEIEKSPKGPTAVNVIQEATP